MKKRAMIALVLTATALTLPGLALTGCGDAEGPRATADEAVANDVVADADPAPEPGPAWRPEPVWSINPSTAGSASATSPSTSTTLPLTGKAGGETLLITRYEEDWADLSWLGIWTLTGSARDSGGTSRYTENAGSSVTVEFTGVSLVLITRTGRNLGRMLMTVDDGSPVTVDCYSPRSGYKQVVWATDPLEPGPHTVTVECAGTANRDSIGTGVYIDAFVIAETPEATPDEVREKDSVLEEDSEEAQD